MALLLKEDETADPIDVGSFGADGVVPGPDHPPHLVEQFGRGGVQYTQRIVVNSEQDLGFREVDIGSLGNFQNKVDHGIFSYIGIFGNFRILIVGLFLAEYCKVR